VVTLSAPSGGGKTTIAHRLRERHPDEFDYSVSATTRPPRPGERDGQAYVFLTRDEFLRRRDAAEFLEWAEYAGHLYGTLRSEVERIRRRGRHVLLDIEVQGARQVRAVYPFPASLGVFVVPPTPRILLDRIRTRRTESPAEVGERLEIAVREVRAALDDAGGAVFDHILVNDELDRVADQIARLTADPAAIGPRNRATVELLETFLRELQSEAVRLRQSSMRSR
jgi:guanylate kinase